MTKAYPGFREALAEVESMHLSKGADYGNGEDMFANIRASEEFGIPAYQGAIIRANDKMSRLKTHVKCGKLKNESVEDSLLDLANYAIIALVLYREKQSKVLTVEKCSQLPPTEEYGRDLSSLAARCESLEISDR